MSSQTPERTVNYNHLARGVILEGAVAAGTSVLSSQVFLLPSVTSTVAPEAESETKK